MLSSVLNEGVRGIQGSQRELQRTANDIARVGVTDGQQGQNLNVGPTSLQPVEETKESSGRSIEESLIEQRRQEQIFTANAQVVSVANQTLGSLIDVKS